MWPWQEEEVTSIGAYRNESWGLGTGERLLEGQSGKGGLAAEVEANVVTAICMLSCDGE